MRCALDHCWRDDHSRGRSRRFGFSNFRSYASHPRHGYTAFFWLSRLPPYRSGKCADNNWSDHGHAGGYADRFRDRCAPGGLVRAAMQIAGALEAHRAKVTVYVPVYAMSGGTLLALATDETVLGEFSVLGLIDPQCWATGCQHSQSSRLIGQLGLSPFRVRPLRKSVIITPSRSGSAQNRLRE
jgi:hypothetical protein